MIQLLADSLVLQLLSVQFVCRSEGGRERERQQVEVAENAENHGEKSEGKKKRNQRLRIKIGGK